ncbi:Protein of unknown function [Peptostreptococcus russellii]|uniref:DUF2634 domain-containing protein n=1 Tax=Peptostreptococcus russellii TaxID=215200 RepID=A0A1H8JI52_9FIRM|nr:DUF2634 domain-containing protein [Peptostreptococcus russellii]SEN79986.1 Protein of unknown function [Peptostreptococcus russellii]
MIPNTGMTQEEFQSIIDKLENDKFKYNSKDYKLSDDGTRIEGVTNGTDEIAQTLYFIINIERYKYATVSSNTGVELVDKFGEDPNLVNMKIVNTIKEAFLNDDRVKEILDIELQRVRRGVYSIYMVIQTTEGKVSITEVVNTSGL